MYGNQIYLISIIEKSIQMERAMYLSTRTNVFFTYQEMSFQLIYGHEHKT